MAMKGTLLLLLLQTELLLLGIAAGFQRGPHHPRAAVSGEPRIVSHHHQQHQHPMPQSDTKFTQDKPIMHDKRHIEEDLGLPDIDEHLTDEELEFRYFIAHDYDENTMLDGLELMSAFAHNMENVDEGHIPNMENYTDLVDQILRDDDINYDGFLSYTEYVIAKNKLLQEE